MEKVFLKQLLFYLVVFEDALFTLDKTELMNKGDCELPSEKTKNKCLSMYGWLRFTDAGIKCSLCTQWHKKINLCNLNFITGSKNYKISSLSDHKETEQHKKASRLVGGKRS